MCWRSLLRAGVGVPSLRAVGRKFQLRIYKGKVHMCSKTTSMRPQGLVRGS